MNLPLLQAFSPPSFDQLEKALQDKHTIALTGLPDGQAAFVASCLAERTHKRILLVQTNDLKAGKAADDLQQLVSVRSAWPAERSTSPAASPVRRPNGAGWKRSRI